MKIAGFYDLTGHDSKSLVGARLRTEHGKLPIHLGGPCIELNLALLRRFCRFA